MGLRQRQIYQTSFAQGLAACEAAEDGRAAEEMAILWRYVVSRLPTRAAPAPRRTTPYFLRTPDAKRATA